MRITLKVLILSTSFPFDDSSTSGIFVARLARHLAKNHEVTVLTPADGQLRRPFNYGTLRIIPFRYAPLKWQVLAHAPGGIPVVLSSNPLLYLLTPMLFVGMFIACFLHARQMDVLHANWAICGIVSGLVGKLLSVPVVTTLRGEDMTRASSRKSDRLLLQLCLRLSDRIIGVSQAIIDQLRQMAIVTEDQLCLIENGVDEALLSIKHEWIKGGYLRLITIGSLIPRKGVDIILKGLSVCNPETPLQLTIVGEGVEENNLRAQVSKYELNDRIVFLGSVSPEHISELLGQHDVLILASYNEGRPNVILEAMAAGMPVIASAIPGVNELVTDGTTGLLFRVGQVDALSKCIESLSRSSDLLEYMGCNGRRQIMQRGLLWHATADKYSMIYKSVQRSLI